MAIAPKRLRLLTP